MKRNAIDKVGEMPTRHLAGAGATIRLGVLLCTTTIRRPRLKN